MASPRLISSLEDLRRTISDLRRRPDVPVWLPAGLAQMTPSLGEAVALARALASLETGVLEDEVVDVAELLVQVTTDKVRVEMGPGVTMAYANPTLLRLALEALIDRARRQGGPDRIVEIRSALRGHRVALRVGVMGAVASLPDADLGVALARKVAELHGGTLGAEADPEQGAWAMLDIATA
jgi:signal transduction histidine kinase